ncbi:MAG: flagella basal body P-ring formation protein FlgA [Sphingomonas adhaesiva]|uniref:flagella basal body P-ring formation protein FlgA n=1 Tax=Sphingomonas adhaesiva TaxID=28212 RepID=UPI002FF6F3BE
MVAMIFLMLATAGDCVFLRTAVDAGAVVAADDVERGACPDRPVPAKLRYDARRHVAVARAAMTRGEALGRVYVPARSAVMAGDRITMVSRVGHVAVSQEVVALQPAEATQRLFVRDGDGRVVLAPRLAAGARR